MDATAAKFIGSIPQYYTFKRHNCNVAFGK
jgi:hypothetical protein